MIYVSLPYVGGGSHAVYDCMKCQKDGHVLRWHAFDTFFVLWHGHTLYGMEPLGTIPFFARYGRQAYAVRAQKRLVLALLGSQAKPAPGEHEHTFNGQRDIG